MLGKLIKYEWKSSDRLFFTIHGFILVFGIVARLFMEVFGGIETALSTEHFNIIGLISGMLTFGFVVSVSCSFFFTHIFIGYRFYKNVFTDQGYLTNTLPVTPDQIILSKGITGLAWTVINILTVLLSGIIFSANSFSFSEMFRSFREFFGVIHHVPACGWLGIVLLLLTPFIMIALLYFSVAVGNLIASHKVLGAVITYFVTNFATQIIYLFAFAFSFVAPAEQFANQIEVATAGEMINTDMMTSALNGLLCPGLISSIILTVVLIAVFWFVTRLIMTKKLNLQ